MDGSPITPISMFASNSITRDLVSDGPVVLAPWSNGLLLEIGPVLTANNIPFQFGVTGASFAIDDQLIALTGAPGGIEPPRGSQTRLEIIRGLKDPNSTGAKWARAAFFPRKGLPTSRA